MSSIHFMKIFTLTFVKLSERTNEWIIYRQKLSEIQYQILLCKCLLSFPHLFPFSVWFIICLLLATFRWNFSPTYWSVLPPSSVFFPWYSYSSSYDASLDILSHTKKVSGFACTYHPAIPGSNPKHTIHAFTYKFCATYICHCVEKKTKINTQRPGLAHIKYYTKQFAAAF